MKLLFACGASYENVRERPEFTHVRSDGRGRMAVYDSEGGVTGPTLDGREAPCRWDCPTKRKSGRKHYRCFPGDEERFREQREAGGRLGIEIPWRHVVTCYCEVIEQ